MTFSFHCFLPVIWRFYPGDGAHRLRLVPERMEARQTVRRKSCLPSEILTEELLDFRDERRGGVVPVGLHSTEDTRLHCGEEGRNPNI